MTDHGLTEEQLAAYERDGFLFPLPLLSGDQAGDLRSGIEGAQSRARDVANMFQYTFNVPHLVIPQVQELVTRPDVLDRVEAVMGPDIMLWAASLFIKEANTTDFVSWHQDLRYWGLDDDAHELTVWVAVTDVTPENGAMRFVPGSHRSGLVEHSDTFSADNQLSRGQEIAQTVDEADAVTVALKAGDVSMHHGSLFHASGPNTTADRRIGLAVRYICPEMRQGVGSVDHATLVRGVDRYGHFEPMAEPTFDFDPFRMAAIDRMLLPENEFFYKGAEDKAPAHGRRKEMAEPANPAG
ncbi:MAG: phytanoyl-CoA dioxygenase family protein [Rhodospirillaceae bacterium]|nr:phytanoyl-CoA dioxygenase family protein [Rhodospirillaceae bacterium]